MICTEPPRFIVVDSINKRKGDHLDHLFITCDPRGYFGCFATTHGRRPADQPRDPVASFVGLFGRCFDSFHSLSPLLARRFPERTIFPSAVSSTNQEMMSLAIQTLAGLE